MLAVSEYQVFRTGRDKLVFHIAVFGTHVRETEGIEHFCIVVDFVVEVHRLAGHRDEGPFRYDGFMSKRDVSHGLSQHGYWQKSDEFQCTKIHTIPILTKTKTMHTLSLFHEAVNFVHLCHRGLRPALLLDNRLHFVTKSLDVLRIGRQVVKCLSETLKQIAVRATSYPDTPVQRTFEDV